MSYIDCIKNDNICYLNFGAKIFDVRDMSEENIGHEMIPVYGLLGESNSESDFIAKPGDFVIGGGSGEHPALVVNIFDTLFKFEIINDDDFSEYIESGLADRHSRFEKKNWWGIETGYALSNDLQKWGYNPHKHHSIQWFMSINLVSFLYHKFKFEIPYLPYIKFELPQDETLHGNMFTHYNESYISPGEPKEWYQNSLNTNKSYMISLQEQRENKIDKVVN